MRILIIASRRMDTSVGALTSELTEKLQAQGHHVSLLKPARAMAWKVLAAARHADVLVPVDVSLVGPWLARWLLWRPYTPIMGNSSAPRARRWPILPWLICLIHRNSRRILALNSATRNALLRLGVPRKRLELAPPPASLFGPAPLPTPEHPRLAADLLENTPLTASALFRILDNVLEDFPTAQLCLSGAPDAMAAAEARVQALGLEAHVQFNAEAVDLLRLGGVALVLAAPKEPANARFALNAAGAGLPVVAMRADAINDWLKDGETASLVAPGDEHAAVAAISNLITHSARTRTLVDAARARIQSRHQWDDFIRMLLDTGA